jgi:hypothetical protein
MLRRQRLHEYVDTDIFQAQQFNLYFAKFVCLLSRLPPPLPPNRVHSLSRYFSRKVKLGPANRRQKLGMVWRNRKKISQIINDYLCLPFSLLIILCRVLSQVEDRLRN